jgi:PIN domain nuclease of toxin-antitoxin system
MSERLPTAAQALIDAHDRDLRFSPIAALELGYLHEVGRARDPLAVMLDALRRDIGLEVDDASFAEVARAAVGLTWTRDPFDRLIAAHAVVADATLLTADRTLLEHLPQATWG